MDGIEYSSKYYDDDYEYRHVILPTELARSVLPRPIRLLTEKEWRSIGVTMSRGWVNYLTHEPEAHILLFRRELGTDPLTGKVDPKLKAKMIAEVKQQ